MLLSLAVSNFSYIYLPLIIPYGVYQILIHHKGFPDLPNLKLRNLFLSIICHNL